PPTSPLFPYTTLFRSRQPCRQHEQGIGAIKVETLGHAGAGGRHPERGGDVDAVRYHGDGFAFEARQGGELVRALVGDRDIANARDRKSTRLNSSHRTI